MATPREKAQCISRFVETKSDLQTRRNFRTRYGEEIHRHVHQFLCMAREIYGDRDSVRQRKEWTIKNIRRKHRSFKKSSTVSMCFVQLMLSIQRCVNPRITVTGSAVTRFKSCVNHTKLTCTATIWRSKKLGSYCVSNKKSNRWRTQEVKMVRSVFLYFCNIFHFLYSSFFQYFSLFVLFQSRSVFQLLKLKTSKLKTIETILFA